MLRYSRDELYNIGLVKWYSFPRMEIIPGEIVRLVSSGTVSNVKYRRKRAGKKYKIKEMKPKNIPIVQSAIRRPNGIRNLGRHVELKNLIVVKTLAPVIVLPGIMCANIRSLANKLEETQIVIESQKADLVILTETWSSIENVDGFNVNGYKSYHKIRTRSDKKHGGGISIFVRDVWNVTSVKPCPDSSIDIITVVMRIDFSPRVIPWIACIGVYFSPGVALRNEYIEYLISEIDRLLTINYRANIIVLGDFNDLPLHGRMLSMSFRQLIKSPTRGDRILDKCYVSGALSYRVVICPPIGGSDHNALILHSNMNPFPKSTIVESVSRPRSRDAINLMSRLLSQFDWGFLDDTNDTNVATDIFHDCLLVLYRQCFSEKTRKINSNSYPWFNSKIRSLIKKRDIAFKQECLNTCSELSKMVKKEIYVAKKKLFDKMVNCTAKGSRDFFKAINIIADKKTPKINFCFPDADVNESFLSIYKFFESLANSHPPLDINKLPSYLPALPIEHMEEFEIYQMLKNIKSRNTSAPMDVPEFIYSEFALELSGPVTRLINLSFANLKCPDRWKLAYITLLPKNDCPTSPEMLRPISLTYPLAKVSEKIIFRRLIMEVKSNIDKYQFGGIANRSIDQYITIYIDYIMKAMENRNTNVFTIVTDFKKAYDNVDHNVFIRKLFEMNPPGELIAWISSFITDRHQIIRNDLDIPNLEFTCSNGIPQGTVLGGLIFVILVNDLAGEQEMRLKYIDDLTIVKSLKGSDDVDPIHGILSSVSCESANLHLSLNLDKCYLLVHSNIRNLVTVGDVIVEGNVIRQVDSIKILGIHIQSNLKWDIQIKDMIKRAHAKFYVLMKLKKVGANRDILTLVYCCYIRPHLEYCASIWHSAITKKQCDEIEQVQRRALKIICGYKDFDYCNALKMCNIAKLEVRRDYILLKRAKCFFDEFPDKSPFTNQVVSGRVTRGANFLQLPKCKTMRHLKSVIPSMVRAVNLDLACKQSNSELSVIFKDN